jgi:hypothetical protein
MPKWLHATLTHCPLYWGGVKHNIKKQCEGAFNPKAGGGGQGPGGGYSQSFLKNVLKKVLKVVSNKFHKNVQDNSAQECNGKIINRKQSARWQHVSQLKARAFQSW